MQAALADNPQPRRNASQVGEGGDRHGGHSAQRRRMGRFAPIGNPRDLVACSGRYRYVLRTVSAFRFIPPWSPIRAKEVPVGDGWLHEVKFDGYRVQDHKMGSRVIIYSRNGHDFTERFPSVAQLLRELPAKAAVLDGEVVASDADGRPNFARLHVRWTR